MTGHGAEIPKHGFLMKQISGQFKQYPFVKSIELEPTNDPDITDANPTNVDLMSDDVLHGREWLW